MSNVSGNFLLAVFNLDGGPLMVAGRAAIIGGDTVYPAVLSWGGVTGKSASLTVSSLGLPADLGFWVRRGATVYDMPEGASSLAESAVKFDGIVQDEPTEQGAVLSIALCEPRLKVKKVPSGAPISADVWPLAADEAMGQVPPEVFGTVEECRLLPVRQPAHTTLSAAAFAGTDQLQVSDATGLSEAGAVIVDGRTYTYSAKADNLLLGMDIKAGHKVGAVVAQVGPWQFLAAGHAVESIRAIKSRGTILSGASVDLDAATVTFDTPPLVTTNAELMNVKMQFDRVSGNGNSAYVVEYTIKDQQTANGQTQVYYNDLDVWVVPPQTVISGNYVFTVAYGAAPDQTVDNPGAYTASLGGVEFALTKLGGTVNVTVPVTAATPLRLQHMVNGGLASILPRIQRVEAGFFVSSNPKPALNQANAIRFGTPQAEAGAVLLPTPIVGGGSGAITFARPGADRIISGTYFVAFTVAGSTAGRATVKIGNDLVWVMDGGVVIYSAMPATISFDDDADVLPVAVDGPEGIVVTVTAASRVVVTGNIDDTQWATLSWPNHTIFRADQTTVNPDLGPIRQAQLVVKWFSTDQLSGHAAVRFGGLELGKLTKQSLAGQTISKTIAVDVVSQGKAELKPSNISTVVGGGTTTLSNKTTVWRQSYQASYTAIGATQRLRLRIVPPQNVSAGVHTVTLRAHADGTDQTAISIYDDASSWSIPESRAPSIAPGGGVQTGFLVAANTTTPVGIAHDWIGGAYPHLESISVDWNVTPITETNAPAYGGTTIPNGNLPNSGIAVAVQDGNIEIRQRGDQLECITTFDLPTFRAWSDFTNRTVEIEYLDGSPTADIGLREVSLLVHFDQVNQAPAGTSDAPVTATITGRSGNPADVLRYLAEAAGETVAVMPWLRLKRWADAVGFTFGRRLSEADDASTLLAEAAQAALVQIAATEDGKAFVRRLDEGSVCHTVTRADLMQEPEIEWASPNDSGDVAGSGGVWNELVLRYRHIDGESTRALTRNATSDRWAHRSERQLGERQSLEVDTYSSWIADDATAALFASDWLRLNAPMRRRLTLALPFTFADVQEGDLIEYEPLGIPARVLTKKTDGAGFLTVTAEELPLP